MQYAILIVKCSTIFTYKVWMRCDTIPFLCSYHRGIFNDHPTYPLFQASPAFILVPYSLFSGDSIPQLFGKSHPSKEKLMSLLVPSGILENWSKVSFQSDTLWGSFLCVTDAKTLWTKGDLDTQLYFFSPFGDSTLDYLVIHITCYANIGCENSIHFYKRHEN